MIASLKSERLKTPNEGSKPEFHLRWIRELVPIMTRCRLVGTDLARFPEARLWPAKGTCPVIRLIRQLNANRFVEARPRSVVLTPYAPY
jgi:hypothetical protein